MPLHNLPITWDEETQIILKHYNLREFDYAIMLCRQFISNNPARAELWFLYAELHLATGDKKSAEEYMTEAFKLNKNPIPAGFERISL